MSEVGNRPEGQLLETFLGKTIDFNFSVGIRM